MDLETRLASVEAALANADAALTTSLGSHQETTSVRLWRGQVLVDWEPDTSAGGCLLRPELLRRLVALHAQVDLSDANMLRIAAPGRIVAVLSAEHADLVRRLGGERKVELRAQLRFKHDHYVGGQETYFVLERGQRVPLLRLTVSLQQRAMPAPAASPRKSPAPT
jgi:hypothetical protein